MDRTDLPLRWRRVGILIFVLAGVAFLILGYFTGRNVSQGLGLAIDGVALFWIAMALSLFLWFSGFRRAGTLAGAWFRFNDNPRHHSYLMLGTAAFLVLFGMWTSTSLPGTPGDPGHRGAVLAFGLAVVPAVLGVIWYRFPSWPFRIHG